MPGQDWEHEIIQAVRGSDIVLVCLTKASVTKTGYVQKELRFALDVADEQPEGAIFLIPVKFEECDVPVRLRRWHWVNLFDANGIGRLLKALHLRESTNSLVSSEGDKSPSNSISKDPSHSGGPQAEVMQWPAPPELIRRLYEILEVELGTVPPLNTLHPGSTLGDLGADSLDQIELIMALEEEYGLLIPPQDAERFTSLGRVVDYIASRVPR